MKKTTILILCVLLLVALLPGCGPDAGTNETTAPVAAADNTLYVGFGRADITNYEPCPLGGLGDTLNRFSKDIVDPLNADCIAITDSTGNTLVFISIDARSVSDAMLFAASKIAKNTGIPYENFIVSTTHSHSAPDPYTNHVSIENYSKMLQERIEEAAMQALADRKPAKMEINTVYPEGYNAIRHYVLSNGKYLGDNFGSSSGATIVGHVREVDNAMQLLKFVREDDKDIIMINWQGHPSGHSGALRSSVLSFSGRITDAVEKGLDVHCMYVLGASGNVNNNSRIESENAYSDYREKAAGLAKYVIEAEGTYQSVEAGKVQVVGINVPCATKALGENNVAIDAYAIGDVALVAAPYEMFCENGEAIKSASPFKMTFVSTVTNGRVGSYIPSAFAYTYNNMPDEVYEISAGAYVQGTAEILQDNFIALLKQLHEAQ